MSDRREFESELLAPGFGGPAQGSNPGNARTFHSRTGDVPYHGDDELAVVGSNDLVKTGSGVTEIDFEGADLDGLDNLIFDFDLDDPNGTLGILVDVGSGYETTGYAGQIWQTPSGALPQDVPASTAPTTEIECNGSDRRTGTLHIWRRNLSSDWKKYKNEWYDQGSGGGIARSQRAHGTIQHTAAIVGVRFRVTSGTMSGQISLRRNISKTPGTWTTFTPDYTNVTKGTGFVESAAYRREGKFMYLSGRTQLGTGGSASGRWRLRIPDGLHFDDSVLPDQTIAGDGVAEDATDSFRKYLMHAVIRPDLFGAGLDAFEFEIHNVVNPADSNDPFTWAINDVFAFTLKIPIEEWSD